MTQASVDPLQLHSACRTAVGHEERHRRPRWLRTLDHQYDLDSVNALTIAVSSYALAKSDVRATNPLDWRVPLQLSSG